MATKPAPRKPRDAFGLEHHQLIGGAFYQCIQVGGFTDRATGIMIPGPKAILDDSTRREVIELTEIPEPVQIPHVKIVIEVSESGKAKKEVERDFTAIDDMPICEGFHLALSTGIIRMVPDSVMEEKYPETWAARQEHYVWRDAGSLQTQKSMRDLFEQAEDDQKFARLTEAAEKAQSVRAKIAEREQEMDAPRKTDPPAAKRGVRPPPPPVGA